jgi:protein-disulfide isomerase
MNGDSSSRLTVPVTAQDHLRGPAEARVTLVEYGDYECPYCEEAYGVIETLRAQMGEQLRFVYRHFPRTEIHSHAQAAAEAAEAAGGQQKFWEMHETLYTHSSALDGRHLIDYGAVLGLDTTQFRRALHERSHQSRVREDFHGGMRSGVTATPTLFIGGIRYDGPHDLRSLVAATTSIIAGRTEQQFDAWHRFESKFRAVFQR